MKVVCPHCKETFELQLGGRKPAQVSFTTVCKALKTTKRTDGKPHYSNAARFVEETTGEHISPALLLVRVQREADRRGIKSKTLLQGILTGQVIGAGNKGENCVDK